MRVIGTGFGRTGTSSLKIALEILGVAPCYDMKHIFTHRGDMQVWHRAVNGEQVDWAEFFEGWEACVDAPASCVWRELLEAFPDALLLHSVLDADRCVHLIITSLIP
jgi:Sulfotransferase domain